MTIPRDKQDREIKVGDTVALVGVVERTPDENGVAVRVSQWLSVYLPPKSLEISK